MKRAKPDTSIELCTVEELVAELETRCKSLIVAATFTNNDKAPKDRDVFSMWTFGSGVTCTGLATLLLDGCRTASREDETDEENDE